VTAGEVVVGIDLGTTSTKVIAYDTSARQLASASAGYPLDEPHPGWAEQDPARILDAVLGSVRSVVSAVDAPVAALSFSSAMHTLIGLDAAGAPLTRSLSWADSRASAQADRLRAAPGGLALHRRTGTPVHPMAPLPKLVWFREERPELFARVARWAGIKDYVLSRLCGTLVIDESVASGTGLLDLGTLSWDEEALELAGIGPERLPELVPVTTVLSGLSAEVADRVGLPPGTPVVVGAGDGPLANLGLGAVHPGVAACSIGTSAALRVTVERPAVDPNGGVFCYALTEHRWVVGGAINNGGIVLEWAGPALAPDLGDHPAEPLLDLAARVPAGSGGLVMLPYLLGERAPHWSDVPLGAYVGLTREHRREHLIRAAIEGVCLQLALVLESMRAAGNEVREVRATGGFARSPLWRQILADALGLDVRFPAEYEGSALGAALLGMHAVGLVDSLDVAADLVQIEYTVRPDPSAAAVYRALLPVFTGLYDALMPTFHTLRGLSDRLPVDQGGSAGLP
jgi:gluconokinase